MLLTKKKFVEFIDFIKERQDGEIKLMKALNEEFDDFGGFLYNKYEPKLIELLKIVMKDADDLIEYFIYELNFGKEWKEDAITEMDGTLVDISTTEKLYDFLVKEYDKNS